MADPTPEPTPTLNPTPNPTPAPEPAPTPAPAPGDPQKQPPWGKPEDFDADKAWELIQNLRNEKGDPKKVTELQQQVTDLQSGQQQQMDAIAKALGLKPEDEPPDPAKLAEQVSAEQAKTTEAESRAATAEQQLAVFKAASTHDANPLALTDSSSFMSSIKDVDHSDAEALGQAIKKAVESNPHFKATPTTPPFPGGPRTPAPSGARTLGEAIAGRVAGPNR